jgi:hypothetical protein
MGLQRVSDGTLTPALLPSQGLVLYPRRPGRNRLPAYMVTLAVLIQTTTKVRMPVVDQRWRLMEALQWPAR